MQVAVIEFARNVLGLTDADSTEFNPATPHPAVVFMPEISTKHMVGGGRGWGWRWGAHGWNAASFCGVHALGIYRALGG